MTGPLIMDFKGDRIMDYQVWYLDSYSGKFDGYMRIPLMKAAGNATACTEWLVNNIYSCFIPVSRHSRVYVPPLFLYLFFYFLRFMSDQLFQHLLYRSSPN